MPMLGTRGTTDRVAGVLNGSDMRKVEIAGTYDKYQGALSVTGGAAFNNSQNGTTVFLTIPKPAATVIMIR